MPNSLKYRILITNNTVISEATDCDAMMVIRLIDRLIDLTDTSALINSHCYLKLLNIYIIEA